MEFLCVSRIKESGRKTKTRSITLAISEIYQFSLRNELHLISLFTQRNTFFTYILSSIM